MPIERLLDHLRVSVSPPPGAKERVRGLLRAQMCDSTVSLLSQVRTVLQPSSDQRFLLKDGLLSRLSSIRHPAVHWGLKWACAFALFLLAIRISPLLFLAPQTIADSSVLVLPTRGQASVSVEGNWQPLSGELVLEEGVKLKTDDGEMTIVFHDDGVVRLAPSTIVEIHDVSDRPDQVASGPTLTLYTGRIWIQGLIPSAIPGITVATSYGEVVVHEGSVSVAEDSVADIAVWDRRTNITRGGQQITLMAGERIQLWDGNIPLVKKLSLPAYGEDWVSQNLQRDAVHRREIAEWQQKRRVALAGILPTSPLYPVKRVAEAMDVLLTFDPETKVQKQLDQAETRLNEAAALLAEGNEEAAIPLEEYRATLLALASGSGSEGIGGLLLRQEFAQSAAAVAAVFPGEEGYVLKRAVLEAEAMVNGGTVDAGAIEGVLLLDTLSALAQATETGDIRQVAVTYNELQPYLSTLHADDERLSAEVRREARSLLSTFAVALNERQRETGDVGGDLLDGVASYLPTPEFSIPPLSEEELQTIVDGITHRVMDMLAMRRSRENQLASELEALRGHPDRSRILRRLYQVLPEWFAGYVREEMKQLREEVGKTV